MVRALLCGSQKIPYSALLDSVSVFLAAVLADLKLGHPQLAEAMGGWGDRSRSPTLVLQTEGQVALPSDARSRQPQAGHES